MIYRALLIGLNKLKLDFKPCQEYINLISCSSVLILTLGLNVMISIFASKSDQSIIIKR